MIGQMAITIAFRGFNNLGRTVTPVFLFMDHFLYQFSTFSEKMKKIYRPEVEFFAKCTIKFRSSLVKFGIIYVADPFLQNKVKIVCLH